MVSYLLFRAGHYTCTTRRPTSAWTLTTPPSLPSPCTQETTSNLCKVCLSLSLCTRIVCVSKFHRFVDPVHLFLLHFSSSPSSFSSPPPSPSLALPTVAGVLYVHVHSGSDLLSADPDNLSDPYCVVLANKKVRNSLVGEDQQPKPSLHQTVWPSTCTCNVHHHSNPLLLNCRPQ